MSHDLPFIHVRIGQFFQLNGRVFIKTSKQYARDFINNKSLRVANWQPCRNVK